jgi:hypothetical protein
MAPGRLMSRPGGDQVQARGHRGEESATRNLVRDLQLGEPERRAGNLRKRGGASGPGGTDEMAAVAGDGAPRELSAVPSPGRSRDEEGGILLAGPLRAAVKPGARAVLSAHRHRGPWHIVEKCHVEVPVAAQERSVNAPPLYAGGGIRMAGSWCGLATPRPHPFT